MNANEYQQWTTETAVYDDAGTGSITALAYVIMALGGEVGEIQNRFKKVLRGDEYMRDQDDYYVISTAAHERLTEELVGVAYYFARLATELELDLEEIFQESHDLLEGRKARGTIQGDGDDR